MRDEIIENFDGNITRAVWSCGRCSPTVRGLLAEIASYKEKIDELESKLAEKEAFACGNAHIAE